MSLGNTPDWSRLTTEGHTIYENAVQQIRHALAHGRTYDQACETVHGLTEQDRAFIREDFLKIIVAEEHLGSGKTMDDLALTLGIPFARLEEAMDSLLHELNRAAAETVPSFPPMVSLLTH